MGKKVNITLDDEVLKFVDQSSKDRSSFINNVLWKEKRKFFMEELEDAYEEQANYPELQEEISVWDVTVGDGLD
jgi:hypothetical protein